MHLPKSYMPEMVYVDLLVFDFPSQISFHILSQILRLSWCARSYIWYISIKMLTKHISIFTNKAEILLRNKMWHCSRENLNAWFWVQQLWFFYIKILNGNLIHSIASCLEINWYESDINVYLYSSLIRLLSAVFTLSMSFIYFASCTNV